MIQIGNRICPLCFGRLKYYDTVKRVILTKGRKKCKLYIPRFRCLKCGSLHNELPGNVIPYKQYEREIVLGVVDGCITSDTLGYENYPCEKTMEKWKSEHIST